MGRHENNKVKQWGILGADSFAMMGQKVGIPQQRQIIVATITPEKLIRDHKCVSDAKHFGERARPDQGKKNEMLR